MSTMRVGGLASGMDTESIVKSLMEVEQMKVDKLKQNKTYLEWQRDDYREMNTMLLNFDQTIFDGVFRQSTFTKKTVDVSDSTALSVKNINSTSEFTGSISIEQLATGSRLVGDSGRTDIDPNTLLNSATSLNLSGTQTIRVATQGKPASEGVEISFDPTKESLNDVINKINSKTGVSMYFDQATGKIGVSADETGAGNISLEDSTGTLFSSLNLTAGSTNLQTTDGNNARFTYNGLQLERSSNTVSINGVELTLKKETSGAEVTYSSTTDTDSILKEVVKFVDEYNKLIEKMGDEVKERRSKEYKPLTDMEREGLSEDEIKKWEEQARKGTLYGDNNLSSALNKMRVDIYSSVQGNSGLASLAEFGIKTSSNYLEQGKLIIDEDKLRQAISDDPNKLYETFMADGVTDAEQGIARRLRDTVKDTMGAIEQKAGKTSSGNDSFTIGRNLKNVDRQIDNWEQRLIDIEDRYWRQFTAMEKMIQQSNSQSSYIMSQFYQ
ncbi:hypothetical protein Q73_12835 [Bacillus coahuilensis m2-6]|uniref:flagellar hook-associated protein 2 n=1 Tax=Bacillus coahuilensis TaxID=408580 RepID=UPI0001850952|nr:flagellar hook-associated protein 2 [Bacillus coahuilensis]KUP05701.1 hypothetical protein Q73_12835 [Bacillus coahuilensis m2-6]